MISDMPDQLSKVFYERLDDDDRARVLNEVVKGAPLASKRTRKVLQAALQGIDVHGFRDPIKAIRSSPQMMTRKIREALSDDLFVLFGLVYAWIDLHSEMGTRMEAISDAPWSAATQAEAGALPNAIRDAQIQQAVEEFCAQHRKYDRRDVLLMAYWLTLNRDVYTQADGAPTAFFHGMPGVMADFSKVKRRQSELSADTTVEPDAMDDAATSIETAQAAPAAVLDEDSALQLDGEPVSEPDQIITLETLRTRLERLKMSWTNAQDMMEKVNLSALETWSRQFSVDVTQLRRAARSVEAALLKRRIELHQRIAEEIAPEDALPYLSALEYISHDESASPQLLLEEDAHLKRIEKDLARYQADCVARLQQYVIDRAALEASIEQLAASGEDTTDLLKALMKLPVPNRISRSAIELTLQGLTQMQHVTDMAHETLRCARRDDMRAAIDALIEQLDQVHDVTLRQSLHERLTQMHAALPDEIDFADLLPVRTTLDAVQAEWMEATRDQDVPHWASDYIEKQDVETLNQLVHSLSRAGKSVEALAMMIAVTHGDPSGSKLQLSEPCVRALLDGMLRIAPPDTLADVFVEVFGNSRFLNAVEFDSDSARLALLIAFIAVQLKRPHCLVADDLYFLMEDSFRSQLPTWMNVAESLTAERYPRLIARDDPRLDELAEIAQEMRQYFERDQNNRFVRLRADSNAHIQRMEAEVLLPKLESFWNELEQTTFGTPEWDAALHAILDDSANDLYDRSCAEANITRAHQGYFRKRLVDRTQSLLDRMKRCIELREGTAYRSDPNVVVREDLLDEMRAALAIYGDGIIQELETIIAAESEATNTAQAQPVDADVLIRRIERFFLTDAVLLSQYAPLTLAFVSAEFNLPEFVLQLARSLTQATPADAIYNLYVNGDALHQAIIVATFMRDRERVRHAQERLNELNTHAQSQIAEIRRHGVEVAPQIERQMGLGQWPLAFQGLERQLSELRQAAQTRAAQVVETSRDLRHQALGLRGRLEEVTQPATTSDVVYRALEAVEEVARKQQEARLEGASMTLNAIEHMLDFNETNPTEIQKCFDRMLQIESEPVRRVAGEFSLAEVIEILHMRAYNRLGLSAEQYTEAGWDDRIQILDLWQAISGMPALEGKLTSADVQQIEAFAFLLAKIAKLRAIESQTLERSCAFFGRERDQVPHLETHFNQPRAVPLRRPVVLLFVTDKIINKARLRRLQQTIDEKDWTKRALVLLVAPCAPDALREFIRQRYDRAAFVIMDEALLHDIVLATRQHSAVGKLRASFLRASGAHTAEVFQFNGQVDGDNSIFVGRDNLVSRLSSAPQCFAVFGGRRIGKTSVLHAIQRTLMQRGVLTALVSFEGFIASSAQRVISAEGFHTEEAERRIARQIMQSLHDNAKRVRPELDLDDDCNDLDDFRLKMNRLLAKHPRLEVVVLIDEMDVYILGSGDAQPLVEVMRGIHTEKSNCRFIFAGFIDLYKQINGKGTYAGRRSPWSNFLDGNGTLLHELLSAQAQQIVREGFNETLGFSFQTPAIPRKIVEYTSGHPAFVQKFCAELHRHLTLRQTELITTDAIEAVFDDEASGSFVDFVAETMDLNLLPLQQLIVRSVAKVEQMARFRLRDVGDVLASYHVRVRGGVDRLADSIDELLVASVLKEEQSQVYAFSVPSYAEILRRLELVRIERFDKLIEEARARGDLE